MYKHILRHKKTHMKSLKLSDPFSASFIFLNAPVFVKCIGLQTKPDNILANQNTNNMVEYKNFRVFLPDIAKCFFTPFP